jgi:pyruvate dehydrogenase E2 component (dihydrolipoamide acetyltransferase)
MFEFKLPDLGEGVHEGQIVSVLVKEGDTVSEYQPMLEVETDKAAVEIPAPKGGVVARLMVQPGQQVKVGQVLVVIDESGAAAKPAASAAAPAAASAARPAAASAAPAARSAPSSAVVEAPPPRATAPPVAATAAPPAREGPVPAAPVVRKLARELAVDLHQVHGTGPGGRVLREDVERFALSRRGGGGVATAEPSPVAGPRVELPAGALPDFSQYGPIRREQPPQIRRTIARQMTRAWLNVPRVTHGDEADITELERNRKAYNAGLKEGQPKLTITAIVMKAVAYALRRFPMVNCSYDAANEEIIYKEYVHIGVAVDTPRGLVVPVLREVDRKPLPQIAAELSDLAERTRTARFEIAELRGATFTITNVGALGGTFSTPMVNFPEVGILGLARSSWQPRVLENMQIVPRLILPMSLSFDHRVVDGADAARFTKDVVSSLENPLRMLSL